MTDEFQCGSIHSYFISLELVSSSITASSPTRNQWHQWQSHAGVIPMNHAHLTKEHRKMKSLLVTHDEIVCTKKHAYYIPGHTLEKKHHCQNNGSVRPVCTPHRVSSAEVQRDWVYPIPYSYNHLAICQVNGTLLCFTYTAIHVFCLLVWGRSGMVRNLIKRLKNR